MIKIINLSTFSFIFFVWLAFPVPVSGSELSKGLEQLVLCEQNSWAKMAVERIQSGQGVKPDGSYFFKPTGPEKVFGYPIKYLGIHGVDLVPGPNVVVEGKSTEVLETIKKVSNRSFKPMEYWQEAPVGKNLRILIFPHPKKPKLTFIQCGYFGP